MCPGRSWLQVLLHLHPSPLQVAFADCGSWPLGASMFLLLFLAVSLQNKPPPPFPGEEVQVGTCSGAYSTHSSPETRTTWAISIPYPTFWYPYSTMFCYAWFPMSCFTPLCISHISPATSKNKVNYLKKKKKDKEIKSGQTKPTASGALHNQYVKQRHSVG